MKKIKKRNAWHGNTVFAYTPDQCGCYYPCQCTSTPTTAFVQTKNQLTTTMYAGSYLNLNYS